MSHDANLLEPSARPHLERRLGLFVLGSLIILTTLKILRIATVIEQPDELTYPSSNCVYLARRVQHGGPMYGDWRQRPHVSSNYGPAFYGSIAYLGRLVGADEHGLFMIGRTLSLLCTLGTTALIILLLWKRWKIPLGLSLSLGLIYFTADEVFIQFDIGVRPDAAACFWTLAGFVLLAGFEGPFPLYGSLAAFFLAFLWKQSSIVGPLSAVMWFWLTGRRRQAIVYAAIVAVLFGATVGLLQFVTHGLYFLNVVDALKGNASIANVAVLLFFVAKTAWVPLSLALLAAVLELSHRRWDLPAIAFVVSTVVIAASTYRDGANRYYYMVPLGLACVLAGRQVGRWWAQRPAASSQTSVLALALTFAAARYVPEAALGLTQLSDRLTALDYRQLTNQRQADFIKRLATYLNELQGPVLCQFAPVGLYCPQSLFFEMQTFVGMADAGVFDDRPLIEQIRQGQIAAIVLDPQRAPRFESTEFFSSRWREAMKGRYRRVQVPGLEAAEIYRPTQ